MNGDSESPADSDETLDRPSDSTSGLTQERRRIRYVGDYELVSEIARGGMGIVFRAKQLSLNRMVAVKIIRRAEYATDLDRLRFRSEAEAAANLDHPNIVPIYEVGEHDGEPYFSMRLIEGGSLADAIRLGRWPIDNPDTLTRAAALVASVSRAVHAAHQYGILHRDLKPGNILLDASETPFVTDFGLAKRVESETPGLDNTHITQTGEIIGTPAFMSPEQASGKKGLTTAADVYSLGAILYTLLAGNTPFQSDSPWNLLQQVVATPSPNVRKLNPQVDLDLATICQKCLEKEPEKRYSSAMALAEDIERWKRKEPIRARPVSKCETFVRWGKRNPKEASMWATVAVASLLLMSLLGMGYSSAFKQASDGRRRVYLHDMTNALECIKVGQHADAFKLLARYENSVSNDGDYRDWEWFYVRNQCRVKKLVKQAYLNVKWNHQLTRCCVFDRFTSKVSIGSIGSTGSTGSIEKSQETEDGPSFLPENRLSSPGPFDYSFKTALNDYHYFGINHWDNTGDLLAIADKEGIQVLSAKEGLSVWKVKHSSNGDWSKLKWSTSNELLAVGTFTGYVDIMDANDGRLVRSFECRDVIENGFSKYSFGFGPGDRWFAIGSAKGIRFFDPISGTLIRSTDWSINELSLDGRWIGSEMGIRNSESGEMVASRSGAVRRNWSLDGSTCIELSGSKYQVFRDDFTTPELEFLCQNEYYPDTISHDGSFMLEDAVESAYLWDLKSRQDSKEWAKPSQLPNAVSIRNDGSLIAYAEDGDKPVIHIYNGLSLTALGLIHVGESKVLSVAVHPTQPQVATLDETGSLRIWNSDSLSEIKKLDGISAKSDRHSESYWKVEYNEDGTQLAAGGGGQVILWKTNDWNEVKRQEGTTYRLIGWLNGKAVIQGTNRPAYRSASYTKTNFRWSNLFKGKTPIVTVLDLPKGEGIPPRDDVSHLLFMNADVEPRWIYMPFQFSESSASQITGGIFELNADGYNWYTTNGRSNSYSTLGRKLDFGLDKVLILREKSSGIRITSLASHVHSLYASSNRSALLLASDEGVSCWTAPRLTSPISFSPTSSNWSRLRKDFIDALSEIFVISLVFWSPLFIALDCLRRRMRLRIAITISFLFCLLATLLVDRTNLMISHPRILFSFGILALLPVPFLLKLSHLANDGKVLQLSKLFLLTLTPSFVFFLWSVWPSNNNPNNVFEDASRMGIGIFILIPFTYWLLPYYKWFRNRTHQDFHSLNTFLFQFVLGCANRTEAWLGLALCIALSIALFVQVAEPDLWKHLGLPNEFQPMAKGITILLGSIGTIASIPQSIVLYYIHKHGLMRKQRPNKHAAH